jgi:hypothetical protein
MGSKRGSYVADFPEGTRVRIISRRKLEEFLKTYHLHHPLEEKQLSFGGTEGVVKEVSFYHGGDELYKLERIPGTWHECCLERVSETD